MEQDAFFQALSNSYRREILRLLEDGERSAGEIAARFDISQPSVSRHLDLLRRTGLVLSDRRKNQIFYALNPTAVREASRWLRK